MKTTRLIITALTIALTASLIANAVQAQRFETARRAHVNAAINSIEWLHFNFHRFAYHSYGVFETQPYTREIRLETVRGATDVTVHNLAALTTHHDGRAGGHFFGMTFRIIIQDVFRNSDNITNCLSMIAALLGELVDNLEQDMPTQDLLEMVNQTSGNINELFGHRRHG